MSNPITLLERFGLNKKKGNLLKRIDSVVQEARREQELQAHMEQVDCSKRKQEAYQCANEALANTQRAFDSFWRQLPRPYKRLGRKPWRSSSPNAPYEWLQMKLVAKTGKGKNAPQTALLFEVLTHPSFVLSADPLEEPPYCVFLSAEVHVGSVIKTIQERIEIQDFDSAWIYQRLAELYASWLSEHVYKVR